MEKGIAAFRNYKHSSWKMVRRRYPQISSPSWMIWRKYRLGLEAELERAMIISREKICHRRQDWNTGALTGSPDMPIHRSRRFTMKDNVTLIPVRKKPGAGWRQRKISQSSGLQHIAVSVQTAMSRPEAMKSRLPTTRTTFQGTLNGSWQEYMRKGKPKNWYKEMLLSERQNGLKSRAFRD